MLKRSSYKQPERKKNVQSSKEKEDNIFFLETIQQEDSRVIFFEVLKEKIKQSAQTSQPNGNTFSQKRQNKDFLRNKKMK